MDHSTSTNWHRYTGGATMATILVVDDEEQIRAIFLAVLERKGHRVWLARDGAEALRLVKRERPDVILLDLVLPDMKGLVVLEHIRQMKISIPVIVVTGQGTGEIETQARALGVTDFLKKSFSLHELGAALKRVVEDPLQQGDGSPRGQTA
jgi:CheY-like chemotaxis protein